jgi:hypothetical protein
MQGCVRQPALMPQQQRLGRLAQPLAAHFKKLCADPLLLLLLRVVPRTAYLHTAALADLLSGAS